MNESLAYARFTLLFLLVAASARPHRADAQNPQRLPQVRSLAQLQRLPATDDTRIASEPQPESTRTISFAAGGVELHVPSGWWTQEVPFGREVRLVATPQRPADYRRMPRDGMWMAYHAVAPNEIPHEAALLRELDERVRAATENRGRYAPPATFRLENWPAAVCEFTTGDSTSQDPLVTGRHVLVRTEWALLEFHAVAPDAVVESRSKAWSATWDSLRLRQPASLVATAPEGAGTSTDVLGGWKAFRSRMHFGADGQIVITADAVDADRPPQPLTGTFEVRDDLIFVRWDDGSRLNLRWRIQGTDLFLTDHEGQISRLKRVFD